MASAPGYRKWPEHEIRESPVAGRVRVTAGGELVADSSDVLEVRESGHPARYYFRRADVGTDKLERSETTSKCPFKGTASYFSLNAGGKRFEDAVWSYEEPYDEHSALKGRLVFYDDAFDEIRID